MLRRVVVVSDPGARAAAIRGKLMFVVVGLSAPEAPPSHSARVAQLVDARGGGDCGGGSGGGSAGPIVVGRGSHSFPFQLSLSASVRRISRINS